MDILALDVSLTSTGFALARNGVITAWGTIPGKGADVQRMIYIRNKVMDMVDELKPALIVFEDFSFGSNLSFVREVAGVSYLIRAELVSDKVPYFAVSPMSLKKFAVGTAGSQKNPVKKEMVLKEVLKRFGHDVNSNDAADAVALAYVAMAVVAEWEPQIDAQREVLITVHKNNPWLKQMGHSNIPALEGNAA